MTSAPLSNATGNLTPAECIANAIHFHHYDWHIAAVIGIGGAVASVIGKQYVTLAWNTLVHKPIVRWLGYDKILAAEKDKAALVAAAAELLKMYVKKTDELNHAQAEIARLRAELAQEKSLSN